LDIYLLDTVYLTFHAGITIKKWGKNE
jgi:hypothetical protein